MGRAGEPVSVLNLDAPQLMGAIVTELLHSSQEALWAIALLPIAFGKSTADGASGIQMERAGLRPSLSPYLYFIQLTKIMGFKPRPFRTAFSCLCYNFDVEFFHVKCLF